MEKNLSIFISLFVLSSSILFVKQGMACDCECSTDSPPVKSNSAVGVQPPANAPSSSSSNHHRPQPPANAPSSNYQMQPPVGSPEEPSNKVPPSSANALPPPHDDDGDDQSGADRECWHGHTSSLSCHPEYVAFLERNRPVSIVCCNIILDVGEDCSGPVPHPFRTITEHCTHQR